MTEQPSAIKTTKSPIPPFLTRNEYTAGTWITRRRLKMLPRHVFLDKATMRTPGDGPGNIRWLVVNGAAQGHMIAGLSSREGGFDLSSRSWLCTITYIRTCATRNIILGEVHEVKTVDLERVELNTLVAFTFLAGCISSQELSRWSRTCCDEIRTPGHHLLCCGSAPSIVNLQTSSRFLFGTIRSHRNILCMT